MKRKDVQVGSEHTAKVSGRLVRVRVTQDNGAREVRRNLYSGDWRTRRFFEAGCVGDVPRQNKSFRV